MNPTELDFSQYLPYAWSHPKPAGSGRYRSSPEDFRVDEVLGFEPASTGEHSFLQIEKVGQNTLWVLEEIARQLQVSRELFGYSGIKDRHAVTTQWISVQNPKDDLDFSCLDVSGVCLLQVARHSKKLRPGSHAENQFQLKLRDLDAGRQSLETILTSIFERGFPNYFGEQRFGHDNQNLCRGWELLKARRLGRHKKKGIYLSALRSFLFNRVLGQRIQDGLFDANEDMDMDMDMTAPLWGRGRPQVSEQQQSYEHKVLEPWQPLCEALEHAGLSQERRPLRLIPKNMQWAWQSETELVLEFSLPPGGYATALLREMGEMVDASKPQQKSDE